MIILNPVKFFIEFTLIPYLAVFVINAVCITTVALTINYINTHHK